MSTKVQFPVSCTLINPIDDKHHTTTVLDRGLEWGGHEHQRRLPVEGEPAGLLHTNVLRLHPLRQRPVEAVEQVGERELHVGDAHGQAGADPTSGAERHELEVRAVVVDVAGLEPVRVELLGVRRPARRVAADGPRVDEDPRPGRHVVPADLDVAHGLPRQQQRRRRVKAQRLLHHHLEVFELGHVVRLHALLLVAVHHGPHLVLRLLQHARLPDEL
jgi:hypothetical protein